jgi:hypothetical protein
MASDLSGIEYVQKSNLYKDSFGFLQGLMNYIVITSFIDSEFFSF